MGEVGPGARVLLLRHQLFALGQGLPGGEAEDRVLFGTAAAGSRRQGQKGQQDHRQRQESSFHRFSGRARSRSSDIRATGSGAAKIPDPTTQVSTPAATTRAMLSRSMPPSISISTAAPLAAMSAERRRALSRARGRNAWPEKPGFTDMSRT